MKEQFYNQLLTRLSPILDKDSLKSVSRDMKYLKEIHLLLFITIIFQSA